MGAGKTTVGKQLAKQFGMDFVDSDHEIEERTGVSITTIFDIEGEEGFRKRETRMLEELCQRENVVMATGGGAILSEENRKMLRRAGTVIYLNASLDAQVNRTRNRKSRPLLTDDDPRDQLRELMMTREPLYRQEADVIVESGDRSVSNVTREIVQKLES
jgi:shikimate kinase